MFLKCLEKTSSRQPCVCKFLPVTDTVTQLLKGAVVGRLQRLRVWHLAFCLFIRVIEGWTQKISRRVEAQQTTVLSSAAVVERHTTGCAGETKRHTSKCADRINHFQSLWWRFPWKMWGGVESVYSSSSSHSGIHSLPLTQICDCCVSQCVSSHLLQVEHSFNYLDIQGISSSRPTQVLTYTHSRNYGVYGMQTHRLHNSWCLSVCLREDQEGQ